MIILFRARIAPDRKFTTSRHGDGLHLLGGRLWLVGNLHLAR